MNESTTDLDQTGKMTAFVYDPRLDDLVGRTYSASVRLINFVTFPRRKTFSISV